MLKKAGIVVASVAAGLLAVSPLAFAGSKVDDGHHGSSADQTNIDGSGGNNALVNVSDNNTNVPIQACNNDVPVNVNVIGGQVPIQDNDLVAPITGALAILGTVDQDVDQDNEVDRSRECTQGGDLDDSTDQSNSRADG